MFKLMDKKIITILLSATRGHNIKFIVPQSSVNTHLYSFSPSTMRIWNQLPQQAVSAPSLEAYKLHHVNKNYFNLYIVCFNLHHIYVRVTDEQYSLTIPGFLRDELKWKKKRSNFEIEHLSMPYFLLELTMLTLILVTLCITYLTCFSFDLV